MMGTGCTALSGQSLEGGRGEEGWVGEQDGGGGVEGE
jgi:hypothetical protein